MMATTVEIWVILPIYLTKISSVFEAAREQPSPADCPSLLNPLFSRLWSLNLWLIPHVWWLISTFLVVKSPKFSWISWFETMSKYVKPPYFSWLKTARHSGCWTRPVVSSGIPPSPMVQDDCRSLSCSWQGMVWRWSRMIFWPSWILLDSGEWWMT